MVLTVSDGRRFFPVFRAVHPRGDSEAFAANEIGIALAYTSLLKIGLSLFVDFEGGTKRTQTASGSHVLTRHCGVEYVVDHVQPWPALLDAVSD